MCILKKSKTAKRKLGSLVKIQNEFFYEGRKHELIDIYIEIKINLIACLIFTKNINMVLKIGENRALNRTVGFGYIG